jgi:hypothetical protein
MTFSTTKSNDIYVCVYVCIYVLTRDCRTTKVVVMLEQDREKVCMYVCMNVCMYVCMGEELSWLTHTNHSIE